MFLPMDTPILECVPNFSEGRDKALIRELGSCAASVPGVCVLGLEPGYDAHRTVLSFAGAPEAVAEAAFRCLKLATERIDMRLHHGTHPRLGAVDVCPLVPVRGISLEQAAELARQLGRRVGEELGVPVYLYEAAASDPSRRDLAEVRRGEYEGLATRLQDPRWTPDFGPSRFLARSGACIIGARRFLIAYNIHLDSTSKALAGLLARELREKGHPSEDPEARTGLGGLKAIGWYLPSYGCAQVSMNLTDFERSGLARVYEACRYRASIHGVELNGSELIGLAPWQALAEAGRFYAQRDSLVAGTDLELLAAAVRGLGLDRKAAFKPEEKILEWALEACQNKHRL